MRKMVMAFFVDKSNSEIPFMQIVFRTRMSEEINSREVTL